MSNFFIPYPTGLLYKIMHIIIIFNPKDMKFGRLVPGYLSVILLLGHNRLQQIIFALTQITFNFVSNQPHQRK